MKKNYYFLIMLFCTLLLSGCGVMDKMSGLLNFVDTYSEKDLEENPDWTLVKSSHEGGGYVTMVAYKNAENPAAKVAAQHIHNFRSTALLFPDEKNFISVKMVLGDEYASMILNDIDGVRNQEYLLVTAIEDDKFIIKSLTNTKTGEPVHYKITSTPTSEP